MWIAVWLVGFALVGLWWRNAVAEVERAEQSLRAAFHRCIAERAPESFEQIERANLRYRSDQKYHVRRSLNYGNGACGNKKGFDEAYDFDAYSQPGYGETRKLFDRIGPQLREVFRERRREIRRR